MCAPTSPQRTLLLAGLGRDIMQVLLVPRSPCARQRVVGLISADTRITFVAIKCVHSIQRPSKLRLVVMCRGFASSAAGIFSVASFLLQVDQQHVDDLPRDRVSFVLLLGLPIIIICRYGCQ